MAIFQEELLTQGWVPEITFGEAIPMDPYIMEPPVYADGSWQPLPAIRYPEADTYQGIATKATVFFSVPLPDQFGVLERWWADKFRNGLLGAARAKGLKVLAVNAWRDTGPIFSTKYALTIYVAGSPVAAGVIIALIVAALVFMAIFVTVRLGRVENIFLGREGTPVQLIPEGTPAPPGTVGPDGKPVPKGTPAPPGSYIPATPGTPGLLDTVGDLAPLVLIGLLVSMFKKG